MNTEDPLQLIEPEDDERDEDDVHILILRQKRDGRKLDIHHVRPSSRGGTDETDNLCVWHRLFHRRWHQLFTNLTLDEVHRFIDILHTPGEIWTKKRIYEMRETLISESLDKTRKTS